MANSSTRIAALQRYHAYRPIRTREKLHEALDRMISGTAVVLDPKKFKFNKAALAKEAGISIHTLLKKEENGNHRFQDILQRLESTNITAPQKNDDERDRKINELRLLVAELTSDKLKLAQELDQTSVELLKANEDREELRQTNQEQSQELLSLRNRVVDLRTRSGSKKKR